MIKPPTMSINQIVQTDPPVISKPVSTKVKIFYSFKGSETNCLCTFDMELKELTDRQWIKVPLKRCLLSVCSSCPDRLTVIDQDTAVYTANFEENTLSSGVIWEGHGLLSTIIDQHQQDDHIQATGKVIPSTDAAYDYCVEILMQLHPVPRCATHGKNMVLSPKQTLPSMKSLLNEPEPMQPYPSHEMPLLPSVSRSFYKESYAYPSQHEPSSYLGKRLPSSASAHSLSPSEDMSSPWMIPALTHDANQASKTTKRRRISSINTLRHIALDDHPNYRKLSPPTTTTTTIKLNNDKPLMDAYYHQSRRKKRDTKPPNTNDIRPFVAIEKDKDGHYVLPAEVDSWTVLSLGKVVWDRPAFHNQRYIYPVGYKVKKWYRSMVDPHSDTQYTCQILDGGDEPIFQLDADDNPGQVWRGPTPTTVWTIAVRRAFAIRNMDYGHNPVGPDFFGLRKNTIAKMIQDLPNADKCKNYIRQNFEAMSTSKGKSIRRANARAASVSHPSTLSLSPNMSRSLSEDGSIDEEEEEDHTSTSDHSRTSVS
ncbi:uncharacterized protein BYT42DRAFT_94301 [Radiomyces spectabilis]|uniref:uncharacterized protein n=1 Tax=Radiomyces spectabilis TaxID=64574 RepID=UPI0022209873|nr:uncharacterized protein BYT42DRAFT_94301 [Radiomyces spectabilis]KAI8370576.1 hypothetical protein BYT42DRAFT_94301 [Radiomyces spectabilis]